jgi:sigma-B regulation protein RsbQ
MDPIRRFDVRCSGRGEPTLLFAHGFGCDQGMWRFVAPAFEDAHRVVLFDLAGAGGADAGAYDASRHARLDGYADDVLAICEALDLRDAVFVGHSVSCMIGLLAAKRAPARIAGLAMLGPSPCYLDHPPDYVGGFDRATLEGLLDLMGRNFAGWAGMLAPLAMGNPDRPALAGELEASFCRMDPAIARAFAEVTFLSDVRGEVAGLAQPTLLLQARDDAIAPEAVGHWLHARLPRSRLVLMEASGHCAHVSHPDETIHHLRGFLRDLAAGAA